MADETKKRSPEANAPAKSDDDGIGLRLVAIAGAFVAAWLAGRTDGSAALDGERAVVQKAEDLPSPVRAASYTLTTVGYPVVYLPLALWLASRLRERGVQSGSVLPRTAVAAWLSYHAAKTIVHRERPAAEQGDANDDRSYPSGHATAAAAIALSAAYFWLRGRDGRASVVLPIAVTAPIAIGASRIVLGKHWPTDIVGGIATGVAVGAHMAANAVEASDAAAKA